jgi:hypothetical protein
MLGGGSVFSTFKPILILSLISLLVATSCGLASLSDSTVSVQTEEAEMQNVFQIYNTTELASYDSNLRIGVGNFWKEEYITQEGETEKGNTVGLWVSVLDNTISSQYYRAHVNQEIVFGQYKITVLEIGQEDNRLFVRLAINSE